MQVNLRHTVNAVQVMNPGIILAVVATAAAFIALSVHRIEEGKTCLGCLPRVQNFDFTMSIILWRHN